MEKFLSIKEIFLRKCHFCNTICKKKPRTVSQATPLPWSKLIVLCSVLFVNQFGINMLFPFLPFMIHDFFPYLNKEELGSKAGYLGSAYFVGNFFGSLTWGWLSDKVGRRPILIMGVCVTISSEVFFGFSQNFAWAIVARFIWGSLNGNLGVAKTYISEICDDTNMARGFSAVGTTGGIGRIMGSVIGGFLARPASKYSILQIGLFCEYPYSLPCLVGASMSLFSLIGAWLFLDETLVKDNAKEESSMNNDNADDLSDPPSRDSGIELNQPSSSDIEMDTQNNSRRLEFIQLIPSDVDEDNDGDDENDDMDSIIDDSEACTDSEYDARSDTELLRRPTSHTFKLKTAVKRYRQKCWHAFSIVRLIRKIVQRITECAGFFGTCLMCLWTINCKRQKSSSLKRNIWEKIVLVGKGIVQTLSLLRDRKVFLSTSLYGLIGFLTIITTELTPLILVTSHEHGGYNMNDSEIGIILMISAVAQLLFQIFLFPRVVKLLGYRHTFKVGSALFGLACILFPLSNRISGPISTSNGSGSGSGSGLSILLNTTDFCGSFIENNISTEDSIVRIPFRVWAVIMSITALLILSKVVTLTTVMVFISNSTLPETRGTVNGYGQSLAALGRMIGPVTGSPLFAWSENTGKGWPLNFHFVFDILAICAIGVIVLALFLPRSIEMKRERENQDQTTASSLRNVEVNNDSPDTDVSDVSNEEA